jgi:uncharacterized protein (TIGR02265 family)
MSTIPGKLVEGVFKKVLAHDVTPDLRAQLAAVGLDLAAPVPESYPRTTWYRAIELTAQQLYPAEVGPAQQRRLGMHVIESLQSRGIVKGAWLAAARFMGPRRALKQAMDFTDRSPVKVTITERSKHEFLVTADDTEQPEFLAGLLEAAIKMLGGRSPSVALEGVKGTESHFRATWG